MLILKKELQGSILDIGGGGEGFIGRTYREQVIAIDNLQEELDEAPDCFEKRLMDATDLKFDNAAFDNVTFFFSLLYMTKAEQKKALVEAARVLKPNGTIAIWDCELRSAFPSPFCVDVDVLIDEIAYHTTYGIVKKDNQSAYSIKQICSAIGLRLVKERADSPHFYLQYQKN